MLLRSRKAHTKSRFGCLPCKKRRIKCGEETPTCQNCVNRRVKCIYGPQSAVIAGAASLASSQEDLDQVDSEVEVEAQTSCACTKRELMPFAGENRRLLDLRLFFHYTTSTCETLSHGHADIDIWRKHVPEEAVRNEFLMDGILALSSLHIAFEHPESRAEHTALSIEYQNSGLKGFQKALSEITEDNSHAIFAFSIIITMLTLAFPSVCPEGSYHSHSEMLQSIIKLYQGIRIITQASDTPFIEGKFRGLFSHISTSNPPSPRPEAAHALKKLRERVNEIAKYASPTRVKSYIAAVEELQCAFGLVHGYNFLGPVLSWPAMVVEELFKLLQEGDPMTELIFLHYGVLLLYVHDRWWGRDFGCHLIENLAASVRAVDPEWVPWTDWALAHAAVVAGGVPSKGMATFQIL